MQKLFHNRLVESDAPVYESIYDDIKIEELSDLSLEQLLDFYEKIVEMKKITERAIYCKMRMEREGHENN